MKIYYSITFLLLLVYINSDCTGEDSSSVNTCNNKEFSSLEKMSEFKYCCYLKASYKSNEAKMCVALNQTQYDDMQATIKYYKSGGASSVSIDCKSKYLETGLLFLLLLFI